MKNHAPVPGENVPISDILLDTVVSAHYLVLQMRMLTGSGQFAGQAETELMADALSRWAQVAGAKWRAADPEALAASDVRAEPALAARQRSPSTPES